MATSKAREDIKNDLKTLKEDLKAGAREETQRLKEKASEAEAAPEATETAAAPESAEAPAAPAAE